MILAYVPVPKDLNAVKTKLFFNLTKRQLICFGGGILVGLPLFFLAKHYLSASAATLIMILVMLPFFLFAMYEKNGQPLEKVLRNMFRVCFSRPKLRPYRVQNYYELLGRQQKLNEEVKRIGRKAHESREAANSSRHSECQTTR